LIIDENVSSHLITQHLSYDNFSFNLDSVKQITKIELTRKGITLPEITVTTHNKEKSQYVMLKGFFRIYQLQDGVPKYYADGIVEYYLKDKTVKNRLIQFRFFRNESLTKLLAKRAGGAIGIDVSKPQLPSLALFNQHNYSFEENENTTTLLKKGTTAGSIHHNDSLKVYEIFLDKLAPDSIKTISLFGVTFKSILENNIENYYSASINQINKESLLSQQTFTKSLFIDKKKEPKEFINSTEFYVFETTPVYKPDLKGIKLSSNFELEKASRFDYAYWSNLEDYKISPLPSFIENLLYNTLILY
jgi:hypothetical protein